MLASSMCWRWLRLRLQSMANMASALVAIWICLHPHDMDAGLTAMMFAFSGQVAEGRRRHRVIDVKVSAGAFAFATPALTVFFVSVVHTGHRLPAVPDQHLHKPGDPDEFHRACQALHRNRHRSGLRRQRPERSDPQHATRSLAMAQLFLLRC